MSQAKKMFNDGNRELANQQLQQAKQFYELAEARQAFGSSMTMQDKAAQIKRARISKKDRAALDDLVPELIDILRPQVNA